MEISEQDLIKLSGVVKHGVDGWGLEIYSRDEEVREGFVTVYGTYLYERTVKGKVETREIVRMLDRRATQ